MMSYIIKSLKWEKIKSGFTDVLELYEANMPICRFEIQKMASHDWFYRYCFKEYYDDGGGSCKNLMDGKIKCEKIWLDKIKKCLTEV